MRRSESGKARYAHRRHSAWQDPTRDYITSLDRMNEFVNPTIAFPREAPGIERTSGVY
jgi:hypothetical protein